MIKSVLSSTGNSAICRGGKLVLSLAVCLLVFIPGCDSKKPAEIHSAPDEAFAFKRLLVLPFERREEIVCPLCRGSVSSCRIEPDAESSLNKLLMSELRDMSGFELISQEEVNRAVVDLGEPARTRLQLSPDFALQVAGKVNADAVMRNFVFCYRERAGSAAAASKPAAIAFHIHLFQADSGEMIWMGKYEEEQVALSENLFTAPDFFRRGLRWVKVDVLARDGMARAMEDFPVRKEPGQ